MKRLYVQPTYRSLHIGETLIHQIIAVAPDEHYSEMVLDTLQAMQVRSTSINVSVSKLLPPTTTPLWKMPST